MKNGLFKIFLSTLVCYFFVFTLGGQSIEKDTSRLRVLTDQAEYKECISLADNYYERYMKANDSISANWLLIEKLECLMREGRDEEFHELSNKMLAELNPKRNYDLSKKVLEKRFFFYYHKMDKTYVEVSIARMDLARKYGSLEEHVGATLSYISTDIYNKDKKGILEMLSELEVIATDSVQLFRIYSKKASITKYTDKVKADAIYNKAYSYIGSEFKLDSKAAFHREYSRFLHSQGSYSKCISEALTAIAIYEANPKHNFPKMDMYRVISRAFYLMNQYDRSREYINKAIKIADDNKYKFRGDIAKDNGMLLFIEKEYDVAISEMERSADYYESKNLVGATIFVLAELGIMYLKMNDKENANRIKVRIEQLANQSELGGKDYYSLLDFRSLFALYEENLILAEEHLLRLADPEKVNVSFHYKEKAYGRLAKIYTSKNEFKNALKYTQLHQQVKDSLTAVTTAQIAMQMESEYNRIGQNNTIASLDQENKIQELTLSNQKNMLIFGSILLLALGLFSALLIGLFRKIKSQNITIVKALEEKDILLKEIHHRVKNNLQLVSSLLTLQSREVKDEKALEALAAGKSRVRSMAIIHQDLYSTNNLKGISMKKYLSNLSEELFDAYKVDHDAVSLHLEVEDIQLDVDTIIPLGLIINELMTNILKYAFQEGSAGNIEIRFHEKDQKLYLDVKDDGIGIDASAFDKSSSFGNKLIKTLTKQLNGTLKVSGEEGTRILIEIKDYKLAS